MKKHLYHLLPPLLGLLLFVLALCVLHHALREYRYREAIEHFRDISAWSVLAALLTTGVAYLNLTLYDTLACRYLGKSIPYSQTALVGFIGYAFSNNVSLANLAGGSIRYRFYASWGLSPLEIARIVLFCGLCIWLGLCALGGAVFVLEPTALPGKFHLPSGAIRVLGFLGLLLVLAYGLLVLLRRKPFTFRGWVFPIPRPRLMLAQVCVGVVDWALAGAVLYLMLPAGGKPGYFAFPGIFLLASVVGLLSQVPGGLGVFESIVIVGLASAIPSGKMLGSLIAYRAIYYLLPLMAAAGMLGAHEVKSGRKELLAAGQAVWRWVPAVAPQLFAFLTFVAGAVLLFSGTTPAVGSRLSLLNRFLPLPVLEVSHFLGSLAGVGLLLLARGLQRRLDGAYYLSLFLLLGGVVFSLLKGLDYEEATVLALMFIILLPCHRHFYRKTPLFSQRFTLQWGMAILIVLLSAIWLGMFAYKQVGYRQDLWWQFTLGGSAPRSLRASVGAVVLALVIGLLHLVRHAEYRAPETGRTVLDQARPIIQTSRQTYSHLALLGDKSILLSPRGNAFLMFGVAGRSWVVLKDPVGSPEEFPDLLWRFREWCDQYGGQPVFYEVSQHHLDLYIDQGLSLLKIGEEGYVDLPSFAVAGGRYKDLRYACNRVQKEGGTFEIIPVERVPAVLPELRQISDQWLTSKNTREKAFSLGFFHEDYLETCPVAVVRRRDRLVAFANVLASGGDELSIDLMRYSSDAPAGVMDYLIAQLMLWGKDNGYERFCLGMAPLSGLEDHGLALMWYRAGGMLFRHGDHFYNFQGLRSYKEKFHPQWEPRYLACKGGWALPGVFMNIATLISGGVRGVFAR